MCFLNAGDQSVLVCFRPYRLYSAQCALANSWGAFLFFPLEPVQRLGNSSIANRTHKFFHKKIGIG